MLKPWWLALLLSIAGPIPALAWGDEGHRIIALLADALITPDVRSQVDALLAADEDPLTEHDIAGEATWADQLRDSNADGARRRTRQWHFVDNEIRQPSLRTACFGAQPLSPDSLASQGPSRACIVTKIDQFAAELQNPLSEPEERLLALKYLLHLVGDLHQPLHASDDDDRGGNDARVSAEGFRANNLHHYWDTEFVQLLGADAPAVAHNLLLRITKADRRRWMSGSPTDWALDSFQSARNIAYGQLSPPGPTGSYRLSESYVAAARDTVTLQLIKAGVRLAATLDRALGQKGANFRLTPVPGLQSSPATRALLRGPHGNSLSSD